MPSDRSDRSSAKGTGSGGATTALHAWVDRLVAEKRTIDDDAYLQRKDASLRALIEDRYGRSRGTSAIVYRKGAAPKLADPGRPADRSGGLAGMESERAAASPDSGRLLTDRKLGLSDLKTPWGW